MIATLLVLLVGPHAVHASTKSLLPTCECVNFVDGLTTDDIGKTACARNIVNGILGAQRVCAPPSGTYYPFLSEGCPSDHYRCIVSYSPPKFPTCSCGSYTNLNENGAPAGSSAVEIAQGLEKTRDELSKPRPDRPGDASVESGAAMVAFSGGSGADIEGVQLAASTLVDVGTEELVGVGLAGTRKKETSPGSSPVVDIVTTRSEETDKTFAGGVINDNLVLGVVTAESDQAPTKGASEAGGYGAALVFIQPVFNPPNGLESRVAATVQEVATGSSFRSGSTGVGGPGGSSTTETHAEASGDLIDFAAKATAISDVIPLVTARIVDQDIDQDGGASLAGVRPSLKPLVGLCQKSDVCAPTYKFDQKVGGTEYYGCPQDTHRCDVPQALEFREVTQCKGGDVSSFKIIATMALLGYSHLGAPEYGATSVGFVFEGELDGPGIGEENKNAAIAFCSNSNYFLRDEQFGMKLFYNDHLCGGRKGWAIQIPAFATADNDGACERENAEFETANWPLPPIEHPTEWDAGYPFVCDRVDLIVQPAFPQTDQYDFAGGVVDAVPDAQFERAKREITLQIVDEARNIPSVCQNEINNRVGAPDFNRRLNLAEEEKKMATKLAKAKELFMRCAGA